MSEAELSQMQKIATFARKYNIPVDYIFNVGLGRLEDLTEMNAVFNPRSINAFEPNVLNDLYAQIDNDGIPLNCKVHRLAVGAIDGEIKFYAGSGPTLLQGSIYKPKPDAKCINQGEFLLIQTKITRLDSFIQKCGILPNLLWIDAQGAEFDVLTGLGEHLANVPIIHTELYLEEDYEGSKLFDEVDLLLSENFELVDGNPFGGIFDNYIYINKRFL